MLSLASVQCSSFAGAVVSRASSIYMKATATNDFAFGLPGAENVLGEFDPLGLLEGKDKLEVYRLREAELAHGRVAMLAATGFFVQEKFHPLFSGDNGPAIDQIPQVDEPHPTPPYPTLPHPTPLYPPTLPPYPTLSPHPTPLP